MTARETLDGIRARYEASQQALANESKTVTIRIAHRLSESANDVPRLSNAVEAVLAVAERLGKSNQCEDREISDDLRAAIENALKEGQ